MVRRASRFDTKLGAVVSSYGVADRTQVADIDPSMFTEDVEDDLDQPCPLCGEDDNEDHLLGCDGCGVDFHTYCVGLDQIPVGHWFCETCETQRAIESAGQVGNSASRSHRLTDRRTRGQRRRVQGQNQASSSSWARVWQSVWDRLNLDLDFPDFPWEEGSVTPQSNRQEQSLSHQRREFREWERRFRVAERQGGANRFRDTASTLLDHRHSRERQPVSPLEPESPEEIRAWNAFEKAKEIQQDPTPNRRKRKSATASPSDAEPLPQPERQLKRPRTRRNLDLAEPLSDASADVSTTRSISLAGPSAPRDAHISAATSRDPGPSFLQSLLREVESSSTPDGNQPLNSYSSATGHSSPRVSSPGPSPTTSNHPSPRANSTTPPPPHSVVLRPSSPLPPTSRVEPLYPAPDFSPSTSPSDKIRSRQADENHTRNEEARKGRPRNTSPSNSSPTRSTNTSPTRTAMSLSAKSDLQKLVGAALKPHYRNNIVNKDQFTDINRNVSRMLYDMVGDNGITSEEKREDWERIATEEVEKAVKALPTNA